MRRTAAVALMLSLATSAVTAGALSAGASAGQAAPAPREVMFVGNNWDGTATVVDARTHKAVRTLNMIPDRSERMTEILTHPDKLAFYLAVQQGVGEGHDQYTDDMFTTHDGRMVAVSRPSFADVVGIDLASGRSSGASPWRATGPTTWASHPTARGCWSATRRPARCTSSTSAPARS